LFAPVLHVCAPCVQSSPSSARRGGPVSWRRNSTPTAIRPHSWSPPRFARTASCLSGRRRGRGRRLGSSSREWSPTAGGSLRRSGRTGSRFPCGDPLARTGGRSLRDHARDVPLQSRGEVVRATLPRRFSSVSSTFLAYHKRGDGPDVGESDADSHVSQTASGARQAPRRVAVDRPRPVARTSAPPAAPPAPVTPLAPLPVCRLRSRAAALAAASSARSRAGGHDLQRLRVT
jgi:hypothetical protein